MPTVNTWSIIHDANMNVNPASGPKCLTDGQKWYDRLCVLCNYYPKIRCFVHKKKVYACGFVQQNLQLLVVDAISSLQNPSAILPQPLAPPAKRSPLPTGPPNSLLFRETLRFDSLIERKLITSLRQAETPVTQDKT